MQERVISFETAKLAKEKGFDIPQSSYYNFSGYYVKPFGDVSNTHRAANGRYPSYLAPTQAILQKWLRKKKILVEVIPIDDWDHWHYKIYGEDVMSSFFLRWEEEYLSYEEALEAGLKKALTLI